MRPSTLLPSLGLLLACQAPIGPRPGEDFTLRIGDTVTIPAAELSLTFVAITEDSRCPEDVVCVWAGSVPVQLLLRLAGRDTTLLLDPMQGPTAGAVAGWRVELRALSPARHSGRTIPAAEYAATLRVTSTAPTP